MNTPQKEQREMGPQPIDELLNKHNIENKEVVAASDSLTFKAMQRARKGRKLTRRMQFKILRTVNQVLQADPPLDLKDLFNY
jgi:uncharacterized membrane protein YgaE (UPF0421/DUF939 family)